MSRTEREQHIETLLKRTHLTPLIPIVLLIEVTYIITEHLMKLFINIYNGSGHSEWVKRPDRENAA